jgi:hypothetical protein
MLRANHAVRVGLRAASRNPELAFGRALLDQLGNLLTFLPLLLAGVFVLTLAGNESLAVALAAVRALRWPTLGAIVAAAAIAFAGGILFWAGALPLVAADVELDRRPPSGSFALLASRGFARVLLASLVADGLAIGFSFACAAALFAGMPAALLHPTPALLAGAALVATIAIAGSILLDLLGRLLIVRAAAFGEGASAAFGKAASLLGARLGACFAVSVAFLVLDLVAASVAGTLSGVLSISSVLDPDAQLLALSPRIAIGLAGAIVVAWLEVGRMAALAALAMDAEGLIASPAPSPATPLQGVPIAEPVIEALPVEEE